MGLERAQVGRVSVYFASADRQHALELATLSEAAAMYFEQELEVAFPLHLAVLRPAPWFAPHEGGDLEPYGIPWCWVPESLMAIPASLTEGVLILGPDQAADLRRVRFVMLHEFGHLAAKQYLHPQSGQPYSAVWWFEELVATYFAYAFVEQHDSEWAAAAQSEWADFVEANALPSASLDWSSLFGLAPEEFAATYAWYQNLLNLRAAELYDEHALAFLRGLRDRLDWRLPASWTTESLLPHLEELAPGFDAWARGLERGEYIGQDLR